MNLISKNGFAQKVLEGSAIRRLVAEPGAVATGCLTQDKSESVFYGGVLNIASSIRSLSLPVQYLRPRYKDFLGKATKTLLVAVVSWSCLGFAAAQQQPEGALATAAEATVTPESLSAQTANRQRRRAEQPQAQATPQPSPVAEPVAPPTQPAVAAPEPSEPTAEPEVDSEPARPVAPELTPEEKLREQLKLVEELVAKGSNQEAIAQLQLLAAEDRFDPQGFYNIGNALARLDATDAAINAYRKAIDQRHGRYSRASNNLGVILLRQGFWDQAYEAFVSALRNENFRYAEASYNLGRLYAARGEMDRASREWRRAVKVDPNHQAATLALNGVNNIDRSPAHAALARESIADLPAVRTRSKSSTASKSFTLDAESHNLLQQARTDHERGRYEQAVNGFRRVIARNGGYFSPANLELSYSLIELRRNDEAIVELSRVAEKDGARLPISYYHLGRLYEQRGDLQAAEANYLRATRASQSDNAQFLLNLSGVRERRGDFAGALVAMENYIKRKEQMGQRPDWSDTRLKELRERAAAAKQ